VKDELEESSSILNQVSCLNMHKMRFLRLEMSGMQEELVEQQLVETDEPSAKPMEISPYNPLEDRGPTYSHFERLVLHQLRELNMSQEAHHSFCNEKFHDLDDQIHDIHGLLTSNHNRDNN